MPVIAAGTAAQAGEPCSAGDREEWIAFGRGRAETTDEAELRAIASALRVAAELGLLGGRARVQADNRRVLQACSGQPLRAYTAQMLGLAAPGRAALPPGALTVLDDIRELVKECEVRWHRIPRNSRPDNRRADGLANLAFGRLRNGAFERAGLTLELWRELKARSMAAAPEHVAT